MNITILPIQFYNKIQFKKNNTTTPYSLTNKSYYNSFSGDSIHFSCKNTNNKNITFGSNTSNENSIDLKEELESLKNKNGTPFFNNEDIEYILFYEDEEELLEKMPIIKELTQVTTNNEEPVFNYPWDISNISEKITQSDIPIIKELAKLTTEDNAPRFNANDINILINAVSKENIDILKELAKLTTEDNAPMFNANDIYILINAVSKENIDILKELKTLESKDNQPLFSTSEIALILNKVTKDNIPILLELVAITKEAGSQQFSIEDINYLLDNATKENMFLIKEMVTPPISYFDEDPIFTGYEISQLLKYPQKEKLEFLYDLINIKDENDIPLLNFKELYNLMKTATKENIPMLKEAINNNLLTGLRVDLFCQLFQNAPKKKLPLLCELFEIARFDTEEISSLFKYTTVNNIKLIKKMLEMKNNDGEPRFTNTEIISLLKNPKKNPELYKELIEIIEKENKTETKNIKKQPLDQQTQKIKLLPKEFENLRTTEGTPRFSKEELTKIASLLNDDNLDLAMNLAKATDKKQKPTFTTNEIITILKNINLIQDKKVFKQLKQIAITSPKSKIRDEWRDVLENEIISQIKKGQNKFTEHDKKIIDTILSSPNAKEFTNNDLINILGISEYRTIALEKIKDKKAITKDLFILDNDLKFQQKFNINKLFDCFNNN